MTSRDATPRSDKCAAVASGRDIEQQDYYRMLDLARELEKELTNAAPQGRDSARPRSASRPPIAALTPAGAAPFTPSAIAPTLTPEKQAAAFRDTFLLLAGEYDSSPEGPLLHPDEAIVDFLHDERVWELLLAIARKVQTPLSQSERMEAAPSMPIAERNGDGHAQPIFSSPVAASAPSSTRRIDLSKLIELEAKATPGPYHVASDNADDAPDHKCSGLALIDTGRDSDWPVLRLGEWPTTEFIAALLNAWPEIKAALGTPSATERREGAIEGISLYLGTFEEKGDHSPGARVRMAMEEFDKLHATDSATKERP